jgi:hypothetical protein
MGRFVDGKIFLVHVEDQVPMVAFLFSNEANRVMEEFKETGIDCFVKEIHCFGNGLQRVFALLRQESQHVVVAFTSLKDANSMSKVLEETGNDYAVSEISCFEVMRKQPLAKYKIKFGVAVEE